MGLRRPFAEQPALTVAARRARRARVAPAMDDDEKGKGGIAMFSTKRSLCVAMAAALFAPIPAQAQVQGPFSSYTVSGVPINCALPGGTQVPIYIDHSLQNIGLGGNGPNGPRIILNPSVMDQFSPLVQAWWLAHECAHTYLPAGHTEAAADCVAAQNIRLLGILQHSHQLNAFTAQISGLPASPTHLPGPARVQIIAQCAFG